MAEMMLGASGDRSEVEKAGRSGQLRNYGFFGLRSTLAGFVGIAVSLVP